MESPIRRLSSFLRRRGTRWSGKMPVLSHNSIDLLNLLDVVRGLGGYEDVCKRREWELVCTKCGVDTKLNESCSFSMKHLYSKYLRYYEEYLSRKEGVISRVESKVTPTPKKKKVDDEVERCEHERDAPSSEFWLGRAKAVLNGRKLFKGIHSGECDEDIRIGDCVEVEPEPPVKRPYLGFVANFYEIIGKRGKDSYTKFVSLQWFHRMDEIPSSDGKIRQFRGWRRNELVLSSNLDDCSVGAINRRVNVMIGMKDKECKDHHDNNKNENMFYCNKVITLVGERMEITAFSSSHLKLYKEKPKNSKWGFEIFEKEKISENKSKKRRRHNNRLSEIAEKVRLGDVQSLNQETEKVELSSKQKSTHTWLPVSKRRRLLDAASRKIEENFSIRDEYRRCLRVLHAGFSLLFYGFGSKRKVIEQFVVDCCKDGIVIVLNGFDGSAESKQLVEILSDKIPQIRDSCSYKNMGRFLDELDRILGNACVPSDDEDDEFLNFSWDGSLSESKKGSPKNKKGGRRVRRRESLSSVEDGSDSSSSDSDDGNATFPSVYIVVHSVDSPGMRTQEATQLLEHIASKSNIYLIASIDHVSGPLLWDFASFSHFSWKWVRADTFHSYEKEASYSSGFSSVKPERSEKGAIHVLNALTRNQQQIFRILAENQLRKKDQDSFLAFHELYDICRKSFTVNAENTLRSHLNELRDHELLVYKRNKEGVEKIVLTLSSESIERVLQTIRSS